MVASPIALLRLVGLLLAGVLQGRRRARVDVSWSPRISPRRVEGVGRVGKIARPRVKREFPSIVWQVTRQSDGAALRWKCGVAVVLAC